MVVDPVRAAAYFAAIRETVKPGAVVADVGAGPGMLGVYAATLGARRVYLIEPDASVYAAAALAEENGVADRIEIIRAPSNEIELAERADVIISDLRGVTPFHGQHFAAAADMRRRLLAPGGICIPRRDVVMSALVEDGAMYDRTVRAWSDMPVSLSHESFTQLLANRWYLARATGEQLLSDPSSFVTLDYDLPTPPLARRWEAKATRDGEAHGLLLWFDAELTNTVSFSNSPAAPSALYGQAFFPFAPSITLRRGERLALDLRGVLSGDDYAWSWSATDEAGRSIRHSTLHGIPMHPDALVNRGEQFVPHRSVEGEIVRVLLTAADGQTTLGALARTLHEHFGQRFPTTQSALNYVTQLEDLWAR
jgi:16S rRNA G966 N2-methylase RsmD